MYSYRTVRNVCDPKLIDQLLIKSVIITLYKLVQTSECLSVQLLYSECTAVSEIHCNTVQLLS